MELKITDLQVPGKISFNYEELKQQIQVRASEYASMVYTDDQITDAKKDRADLNRLKKALNDERIRQEKEFLQPFNEFKAQVKELCDIIDTATTSVDKQIKEYEEQKRAEKLDVILEYFGAALAAKLPSVPLNHQLVVDLKWLNASVSMKSIQEAIDAKLEQVEKDLALIDSLPSYAFEARECYVDTLDLAKAVSEAHRLQEQAEKKAAWEAEQKRKAEAAPLDFSNLKPGDKVCFGGATETAMTNINDPNDIENLAGYQPVRQWVGFKAYLSAEEAKALGAWLRAQGIKYKAI